MNDVDEKLHSEQRESVSSNAEDGEAEANDLNNENGAAATSFNITFMDPEERALLDMLESEGRSTNESILSKDFLGFPSLTNAPRLSQMTNRTSANNQDNNDLMLKFNRLQVKFPTALFEDESIASNTEDSSVSLLSMIDDEEKQSFPNNGNSIEFLVAKTVVG